MPDQTFIDVLPWLILVLVITGGAAGILAGLLGVGGGIVIVPVLFWGLGLLGFDPALAMLMAVGTSLATIIPTSISSARAHHRRGSVDGALLKRWGPFIFLGALIGGLAARHFGGDGLSLVFGVIALAVAALMTRRDPVVVSQDLPRSRALNGLIPALIGFFSALMGIGGGTLTVPTLSACSFPIRRAVGTSATFGLVIAIPAVVGFIASGWSMPDRPPLSLGYVSLPAAAVIFPVTVTTAPLGARIAHRINPRALRLAFALFLAITAIRMLHSVLS